jgi:hypothetical protein
VVEVGLRGEGWNGDGRWLIHCSSLVALFLVFAS